MEYLNSLSSKYPVLLMHTMNFLTKFIGNCIHEFIYSNT